MSAFDKAGIRFSVITPDRTEEVLQLLAHNFFPDEPLLRSVGIKRNSFMDSFFSDAIKGCFQDMSPVIQGCKWTRSCIP